MVALGGSATSTRTGTIHFKRHRRHQKPVGVGAGFQPSIVRGEQFGLLTRTATESVSSCMTIKSSLRF
jgi:hypothetical protein